MKWTNLGGKVATNVELIVPESAGKLEVFDAVEEYLGKLSLRFSGVDKDRPWGGFFVIDEAQTSDFIALYFPELSRESIERGGRLSPKILLAEPGKRLSWQYHDRREELWKVIGGPVGIITSETDDQGPARELQVGDTVQFGTQIRHRLLGLGNWAVVAEIWQHTDPENPSDESDIVRVEDDFGR